MEKIADMPEDFECEENESEGIYTMPEQVGEMLSLFGYGHLPDHLQRVSEPFSRLALEVANRHPRESETYFSLRKLLEAKDCAVRAVLLAQRKDEKT